MMIATKHKQALRAAWAQIHFKRLFLGALLGTIGGYAYYYFVGCQSGTCAITRDPVHSTLYGALVGIVFLYKPKTRPKPGA